MSDRTLTFRGRCVKVFVVAPETDAAPDRDAERAARIEAVRRAAVPVFAAQGFAATSMADLAEAAGVSRPALYQWFANRADVFRAAFGAVLDDAADAAVAALDADGTVAERLDRFLQRANGDGYEALAATPHGAELLEAKHEFAADVADRANERARDGLRTFVDGPGRADAATRAEVVDLLLLAPGGLKADAPAPAVYRARLATLARSAAALLEG